MFLSVDPKALTDNVFSAIGDQWMLISAGNEVRRNGMTASWGGLGVLFHKNVATIYVRPQRYTYGLIKENDAFALSFFEEKHRSALKLFGSKSGRDCDKAEEGGLTWVTEDTAAPYFAEASLVLVCRKLYYDDLKPEHFLDTSIDEFYPQKDYHRMYIGEITQALVRQ